MIKVIPQLHDLTPIQKQYYNDVHRFLVCSAGRRSRKTLIGTRKVLSAAMINAGKRYFLGAPTRTQAKDIFWTGKVSGLQMILPRPIISSESHSDLWIRLPNAAEIHVVGLDKPQRIEGQPWDGCLITEMADVKPSAWGMNIRPVLSDTNGFAILDGVPEGRDWYYDMAVRAAGGVIPTTRPMLGAYAEDPNDSDWAFYSWFSADVLTAAEIEAVKRELDERTFRQEYEGSFEGEEGRAYYAFSSANLVDDKHVDISRIHVHVGMDFNVDPMTAVICDVSGDTVHQFDEVYLRHSNTYEMVEHLLRVKKLNPAATTIYPDSTGAADSSNATESDLKILRNAGFKIKAHPANPRQRDRLAAVNTRCMSTNGVARFFVQRHCVKTINDLNRVQSMPDGRLDKTQKDTGLTHISDGLGYLIAYLFPIKRKGAIVEFTDQDFY
ncbi:MAG TPA: hypothetical protein DDY86_04045 [Syntrophaceae bacterium]|nr:hypothetical protein [Syntrophaceae bacterium]